MPDYTQNNCRWEEGAEEDVVEGLDVGGDVQ